MYLSIIVFYLLLPWLTLYAGNRKVGLGDKDSMPFTQAFLQEVQRLGAISCTSLPHICTKDTLVQGHNIPAGEKHIFHVFVLYFIISLDATRRR